MDDASHDAGTVLTDAQAKLEASRCLVCDDPPCVEACPADVPVMHFIRAIRFDAPRRAINLIRDRNVFAGVCGVACPVDELCVGACTSTDLNTPIAIGALQHYAADTELRSGRKGRRGPATGKKVAVIGAGPAGLAAAAELARLGHRPTVFEKNKRPGGICTYGVPAGRLPQDLVAGEIEHIKSLGVEIKTETTFGGDQTVEDLFEAGYKAVYISVGLQKALTPGLPGEELDGVTTWKTFLDAFTSSAFGECPPPKVPRDVIIIGGGSVAMDVAAAARELGAEDIDFVCLEAPGEMPAYHAELEEISKAGARFNTRSMPLEITGKNGRATGLKAERIRWKEPGKFVPSNAQRIEGTGYWLSGSMVVFSIGARTAADLSEALPGVALDDRGAIVADSATGATSRPGVYAGGDAVPGGGTTIVQAVAEGKRAGRAMHAYLSE